MKVRTKKFEVRQVDGSTITVRGTHLELGIDGTLGICDDNRSDPKTPTPHFHRVYVPTCFRCDLSRAETAAPTQDPTP